MTSQTTVSIACLNWGTFLDTYLFQIYACATFSSANSANSATWPPARSAWSWRRPSGRHSSALTALGPSLGIPMCPRYPTLWGWWMWMKRTSTPTTLCQVPAVLHEKSVCFACLLAAKKHGLFLVWKPSNGKPPGFKLCVVFFLFFWLTVFYMIWYVYISIIIYICIYLEKKNIPKKLPEWNPFFREILSACLWGFRDSQELFAKEAWFFGRAWAVDYLMSIMFSAWEMTTRTWWYGIVNDYNLLYQMLQTYMIHTYIIQCCIYIYRYIHCMYIYIHIIYTLYV